MPKPKKGARLGSNPTHQGHLLRGLSASLIIEERIRTTEAKAKLLRPFAEKLVTLGKDDTLHARRQALRAIEDSDVVHKLFAEISPRYSERNGGYTRILKLGPRKGDAAPMAIIEFVEAEAEVASSDAAAEKKRGLRRRKSAAAGKESAAAGKNKDKASAPAKPRASRAKPPAELKDKAEPKPKTDEPVEKAPAKAAADETPAAEPSDES